jgi:hypothetical protein
MSTPPHAASSAFGDKKEQRAAIRYHSRPETPLFSIGEQEGIHAWRAKVNDISVSGISLLVTSPFEVGNTVDVELSAAGLDASRTLVAKVVRVEPRGPLWFVACAFITPLSADEVQMIAQEQGAQPEA